MSQTNLRAILQKTELLGNKMEHNAACNVKTDALLNTEAALVYLRRHQNQDIMSKKMLSHSKRVGEKG